MGLANVAVLQWEYGGNNDDFIEDIGTAAELRLGKFLRRRRQRLDYWKTSA